MTIIKVYRYKKYVIMFTNEIYELWERDKKFMNV